MTVMPWALSPGCSFENDSPETARSPSKKLEDAVTQLQRDIVDYRQELRFGGGQGPANPPRPTKAVRIYFHASSQILGKI